MHRKPQNKGKKSIENQSLPISLNALVAIEVCGWNFENHLDDAPTEKKQWIAWQGEETPYRL